MDIDYIERTALQAMAREAIRLGVQGVAAIISVKDDGSECLLYPKLLVIGRFQREADETKGPNDTGANYLAIVCSKIAEMLSTRMASGTLLRFLKKGELGYRGGLAEIVGSWLVCAAFSGGTEDQDVEIAQVGLDAYKTAKGEGGREC